MEFNYNFDEMYNHIKYRERVLTKEEEETFISIIEDYNEDMFHGPLLCLALGSKFLKENPLWLKRFFKKDLNDYNKGALFDAIDHSGIAINYINDLLPFLSIKKAINGEEESCASAISTLSHYTYQTKDKIVYSKLRNNFFQIFKEYKLKEKEGIDLDDYLFYLKVSLRGVLFCLYGVKSYQKKLDVDAIIKDNIEFPPTLSEE